MQFKFTKSTVKAALANVVLVIITGMAIAGMVAAAYFNTSVENMTSSNIDNNESMNSTFTKEAPSYEIPVPEFPAEAVVHTISSQYTYAPGINMSYTDDQMLKFIFKMNDRIATDEAMAIIKAVDKYANKYNLPEPVVLALIKVESNFDAKAVSNAGAVGLMQILPKVWFNTTEGFEFENLAIQGIAESKRELFDIEKNIHAGCYILDFYRNEGITKDKRNPIKYALNRYFGITKSTPNKTHYEKMILALGQMFTVWGE